MTTQTQPLRGPLRKRESHLWRRDPLDWYVEPEWCSARLFELEKFEGFIWDPAAGTGRIILTARAANYDAGGTDIKSREISPWHELDFFAAPDLVSSVDNIVSNPPFGLAEKFAQIALRITRNKVALLLPANWVQGDKRSRWLETTPLRRVLFITPRPSMPPGAIVVSGGASRNGTTDYAWFIWEHGYAGKPEIGWCRR